MNKALVKTKEEVEVLREGGRRLAVILKKVATEAKPGVSTYDLDRLAESLIFESGGLPSFKNYKPEGAEVPYPSSLCVSVNDEVVHAIPKRGRILKEGDIVGLDIGMRWPAGRQSTINNQQSINGLFTDMAVTIGVGKISEDAKRLLEITKEALDLGINEIRVGATIGDIGHAIEKHLKKNNLGVVRDLAGHGVGYKVHEEPLVPNYGRPGEGVKLKKGMVIAIEPISTLGNPKIFLAPDKWTFKTSDGSLSAHFEHTVAIVAGGSEILTPLEV